MSLLQILFQSYCSAFTHIHTHTHIFMLLYCGASQVVLVVKDPPANAGDARLWFHPWMERIPWSREWQPTPVSMPGKFHGRRKLAGYSAWGLRESHIA